MSISNPEDPQFKKIPELDDWLRSHGFPPQVLGKASRSYWRGSARSIISEILERTKTSHEPRERLALVDAAYPFGVRLGWPYKCWLEEREAARDQLGVPKDPRVESGLSG